MRNGLGTLYYTTSKTTFYSGMWRDNERCGRGRLKYASGNVYEGEWRGDRKEGEGVMHWQDRNEVYEGMWVGNQQVSNE